VPSPCNYLVGLPGIFSRFGGSPLFRTYPNCIPPERPNDVLAHSVPLSFLSSLSGVRLSCPPLLESVVRPQSPLIYRFNARLLNPAISPFSYVPLACFPPSTFRLDALTGRYVTILLSSSQSPLISFASLLFLCPISPYDIPLPRCFPAPSPKERELVFLSQVFFFFILHQY